MQCHVHNVSRVDTRAYSVLSNTVFFHDIILCAVFLFYSLVQASGCKKIDRICFQAAALCTRQQNLALVFCVYFCVRVSFLLAYLFIIKILHKVHKKATCNYTVDK